MNIKITKEEANILFEREEGRFVIGSYLYGNQTEYSDKDYLIFYESLDQNIDSILQIRHQFQYDDEENNIDYIFTTENQFFMNLFSGESTINVDLVLFEDSTDTNEQRLSLCRSYNIIKAYLGFAKRDLKYNKDGRKYKHIVRGLYTASCLLKNEMPQLSNIKEISFDKFSKTNQELKLWQDELRLKCNQMYEKDELKMYPEAFKKGNLHPLQKKLVDSCNIKEFKYGN